MPVIISGPYTGYNGYDDTAIAKQDSIAKARKAAEKAKKNATKIKTRYTTERGNTYDVYRDKNGKYFIADKNGKISYFTNKDAITIFDANLNKTIAKSSYEYYAEQLRRDKEYADSQAALNQAIDNLNSLGGGSNDSSDQYWRDKYDEMVRRNEEMSRIMSAPEAAKHFGIDYNEENILKDYNDASNKKFDELTSAQQDLREQTLRNNAQYIRQTADAYLDSYRNAAPTATGRGTLAANMLSNMINASDTLSYNDYGMTQSINALEEERKKELENNKMLAKDYYTKMGTYLSTLSANKNTADVKATIANMDKYATEYAASRKTAAANAAAAANRYSGLASAAGTSANAAANSALAKWYQIYDRYLAQTGGNTREADNLVVNNHLNTKGY